jgi:hypothetical protein
VFNQTQPYGNEAADILAKKGTQIKTKPVNTQPFESAKRLIETKFKKQYTEWISTKSKDQSWENIVKTPVLIPDLLRKEAAA